jgi:hypothetical protein
VLDEFLIYFGFKNIILKPYYTILYLEEKGELPPKLALGERRMLEEVFTEIITSSDGDYAVMAQIVAQMKPNGW